VLAAVVIFSQMAGGSPVAATPSPSASTPAVVSTAPVTMAAPKLPDRASTVCRALLSQLPAAVRGMPQRPVTAGPEQNAAYGDPAITVACGAKPPIVAMDAFLYKMDRVCWHSETRPAETVWTAIDREIPVQVTIPNVYEQPAQWANEFSATLIASAPATKAALPSGCA
jgi:hypothetical protein